jgi:hypothetical protein
MHPFSSQQVAAQDLFTVRGVHAAGETAEIASQVSEKPLR